MFRRLDEIIRSGAEAALEQQAPAAACKPWLASHLRGFLWQLEEHHQVEDERYFPVFRWAEPRLAPGFELLEHDHEGLHGGLGELARRANLVLAPEGAAQSAFRSDLARFLDAHAGLGRALRRHLDDEEDLVIPLLLEHGERSFPGGG